MNKNDRLRKVAGGALMIAGLGVGAFVFMIFVDLFMFWWAYDKMSVALIGHGIEENLSKVVGIVFSLLVTLLTDHLMRSVLKRNKKVYAPKLALIFAVWFGVMYFVSAPYSNALFNVFTGEVRARYYRDGGRIIKMPIGAKIGPQGQPLQVFDQKTAEEYGKQEGGGAGEDSATSQEGGTSLLNFFKQTPAADDHGFSSQPSDNLEFWIEKIQLKPDQTILQLAATSKSKDERSRVREFVVGRAYIADDYGNTYNLLSGDAPTAYSEYKDAELFDWNHTTRFHYIRVDEIYHFTIAFAPIPTGVTHLRLHEWWLKEPLDIRYSLAKARRTSKP